MLLTLLVRRFALRAALGVGGLLPRGALAVPLVFSGLAVAIATALSAPPDGEATPAIAADAGPASFDFSRPGTTDAPLLISPLPAGPRSYRAAAPDHLTALPEQPRPAPMAAPDPVLRSWATIKLMFR